MSKLLEDGVLVMNFIKASDAQEKVYCLLEEQFLSLKNNNNHKNDAGNVLIDIVKAIKDDKIQDLCFDLSKRIFKKHGDLFDLHLTQTHEQVSLGELKDALNGSEYNNKKLFSKVGNVPNDEIKEIIEAILDRYSGDKGHSFLDDIVSFFTFPRYKKVAEEHKHYIINNWKWPN